MQRFAVIGHPIGHTMSPYIHGRLFGLNGICPTYEVLDVPDLKAAQTALRGYDGINITIPHKEAILPYLQEIEEKALRFGSVNTLKIVDGRMKGYTTDGQGCLRALVDGGANLAGRVLLLGSGGAARAIGFSLVEKGVQVDLCARDSAKGQALVAEFGGKGRVMNFAQLQQEAASYSLLINATSVGMYPNLHQSPVGLAVVRRCESVFDAVYNPHKTALLQMGEQAGKNLIFGIDMLVYQAVEAHRIWYGASFAAADLKTLCVDAATERQKVFG